jgi:hypothetical protein
MKIKTMVVLSMHRSATSLVAKSLAHEIDMGAVYRPIDDQPSGNWENLEFVYLNEKILAAAGGSWHEPPSREAILNVRDDLKMAAIGLVNKFNANGKNWGWKDPRTALTIELYEPALINPIYVNLTRRPYDVAKSLQKRNGFSIDQGLKLAKIYNQRINDFLRERYL